VKKILFVLLLVVLAATAFGCSRSGDPSLMIIPTATPAPNYSGTTAPRTVAVPSPVTITQPPAEGYYDIDQTVERMVIKTANLALVVEDISISLEQINQLATAYGGYVINSQLYESQNRLYGGISFRVDATRFNEALNALKNLAVDVRSETTSGQDVTEEYVDLDARLRNLQASESQLLDLMEQAGTIEEILKVQQQLVATREQIEQIKGRMQYLEQSSAMSSISVTLEQSKLSVEFTADPRLVKQGETVRFQASIGGGFSPFSYEWDFGDASTSNEEMPTHTYHRTGTFTVSLKITDDKEHTASAVRADYIQVTGGWTAGKTAEGAWKGLVALWHALLNILIWLGIFSPLWIVILVILYFTVWRKRKPKSGQ
jgi:hypothetical protein